MMMTMMISVELEGVTQRQTESAGDCGLEKKAPQQQQQQQYTWSTFLVAVVVSKITNRGEEISLC